MLRKQRLYREGAPRAEREPRRMALPHRRQSQVLWEWGSFLGCLWPVTLLGPYLV